MIMASLRVPDRTTARAADLEFSPRYLHQVFGRTLARNLNGFPKPETRLLIATNRAMILDLRSDDTFGRPLVGEHDSAKEFPQYRWSGASAHELDLPHK